MLGRSACLRSESFGARREKELASGCEDSVVWVVEFEARKWRETGGKAVSERRTVELPYFQA